MGLDMFLCKRTSVQNWPHQTPAERYAITVQHEDGSPTAIKPERITHVIEEVAYWRKANHIHRWFAEHIHNGVNDGREVDVSREQLATLVELCRRVLADTAAAPALLPTQDECFFSDTTYGALYFAQCTRTIEMLAPLLGESGDDFFYRASW